MVVKNSIREDRKRSPFDSLDVVNYPDSVSQRVRYIKRFSWIFFTTRSFGVEKVLVLYITE